MNKKETLKELLIKYNTEHGYGTEEKDLYKTFCESFKTVWKDPNLDVHRWYNIQDQVVQIGNRFFMHYVYIITGDMCAADMDLYMPEIDDIDEVFPKEITTIVYELGN